MSDAALNRWLLVIALAALIVIPTVLTAWLRSAALVWPVALACMAAVLLIRLPDVELFKVGPLEARLRRATEKAEATVEQLQELATKLARPVLGTMAGSGRWGGGTPRRESVEVYEDTLKLLKELGSKPADIAAATARYRSYLDFDLVSDLADVVLKPLEPAVRGQVQAACFPTKDSRRIEQSTDTLKACLTSHGVLTPDAAEALADLAQFRRDETLRRREVFIQRRDGRDE